MSDDNDPFLVPKMVRKRGNYSEDRDSAVGIKPAKWKNKWGNDGKASVTSKSKGAVRLECGAYARPPVCDEGITFLGIIHDVRISLLLSRHSSSIRSVLQDITTLQNSRLANWQDFKAAKERVYGIYKSQEVTWLYTAEVCLEIYPEVIGALCYGDGTPVSKKRLLSNNANLISQRFHEMFQQQDKKTKRNEFMISREHPMMHWQLKQAYPTARERVEDGLDLNLGAVGGQKRT